MACRHQQTITDARLANMNKRLLQLNAHVLVRLGDLCRRTAIYAGPLYGINRPDQITVVFGKLPVINCLRGTAH